MVVLIDRAIRGGLISAAMVMAGYALPAFAFEFGGLSVRSHLNQPLDATVALDDLDVSEQALDISIAPQAMFDRFGIRRSSVVDRIHIDTQKGRGSHRAVVHIATERPVNEPFVDFLLQVDSGNGTAVREYTAMLDPADYATSVPDGSSASPAAPVRRVPAPSRRRPADKAVHHDAPGGRSSQHVVSGDTLWSIAAASTPSGATMAQTVLAIYRANPSAFAGSMDALSANTQHSNAGNPTPDATPVGSQTDAAASTANPSSTMQPATAPRTPPPSDVSQPAENAWLSPRNLLLLVVLLVVIGWVWRRLRERGYKPVPLDREAAAADDTPAETPATVPATVAAPSPSPPTDTDEAPPADTIPTHAVDGTPERESAVGGAPLRFEPVTPPAPNSRLFAHRQPATHDAIEALVFEAQSLPDSGERQHDRGDTAEPGLAFEATAVPGTDASDDAPQADAPAPASYDLEMIDPGEFDLYDPSSDTVDPADDDSSKSVAIRLDVARMYVEMDDAEATRGLLAEVHERGDEAQRDTAEQLLDRLDS